MSEIAVRRAVERDVPAMAALEAECFSAPWSERSLASELGSGNAAFFMAEVSGAVVGYAGMQTAADEGSVFNVAVAKNSRRMGVGRALARALTEFAREKGLAALYLEVRPSNLAAIALYEREGYVFCGLRRDYYTAPKENAILMKLDLAGPGEKEDIIDGWPEL